MPYLSFRMNLFCPFRPLLPVPFLEKLSVWGRQQGRVDSTVEPGAKGVIPTYEFAGGGWAWDVGIQYQAGWPGELG